MSHKRTLIRAALVARLTGLTTCGAHVYASRLKPLAATELPAILVTTAGEDIPASAMTLGRPLQRDLGVHLLVIVKAVSGYEDTADTILGEIEAALFDSTAHNTLDGTALSIRLASIADPEMDDGSDKPVVRLPIILRVTYSS